MENSTFYWNRFSESGKISDYLQYKQALLVETAQESASSEETYASEYRRTGSERKDIG